ncbi:hypothetical protein HID58_050520, partial [Brassica napus]
PLMLKPTSFLNYFNTIITCKSLSFGSENFSVAKDLNLSPLVKQPALANRYNTLVNSCLKANNLDAHFLKGMLEYFQSQNQFLVVEDCLAHFHRSLERTLLHMKDIYVSSVLKMWPDLNCHPQEGADNTVCSNCFHFFLLTKFYKMMLGFNDLLD